MKFETENHNYHDSNLKKIEKTSNGLKLIIDIDTHWAPGKKYGILTLKGCSYDEEFIKAWEDDTDGWLDSIKLTEIEECSLFEIVFHSNNDKKWILSANSYVFNRTDTL